VATAGLHHTLTDEQQAELRQYIGNGNGKTRQSTAEASNPKRPLFELMSAIAEEEINPFWAGRIARGKLTLFAGDSGVGKSTCASQIVATSSRGGALPFDREPEMPMRSLIVSAEEGVADMVKPRLRKMGADMDMIAVPHRDYSPSAITAEFLDGILSDFPAAVTVLDPITSYAQGKNTFKPSDVRDLLMPFVPVAEKHKTAIIMIAHLNKPSNGGGNALDRILGSVEFRNIPRSIFLFARDAENPARRLMTHAKCSFGPEQPTLEFFIDNDTGEFRWGGETNDTAADALSTNEPSKHRERLQMDRAIQFLQEQLAQGPKTSVLLEQEAEKLGLKRAIWRAKAEMGIRAGKAVV
jgi:RecA-family ATPase